METYAVINDVQCPYHDPRALDVCGQILKDAKVDMLVYNGDWGDFRCISRYPVMNRDERLFSEMKTELKVSRERLHTFHKAVKPKKAKWNDGNHEWRVVRTFEKMPSAIQVIEIAEVGEALSIPSLFKLNELGIKYSGTYPNGCWLHGGLGWGEDVWVEHGYTARQKGGYTVTGVMEKRWASVVIGHCERLAIKWYRPLDKRFFGIENGNLSIIAEPAGKGIYGGVPHSVPEYMDHMQGFSIIYRDAGQWHPYNIKIDNGVAVWNGKRYKA